MGTVPFHESGQQYNREGASEQCLWNEHLTCRSPRCGCSCHRANSNNSDNKGEDAAGHGRRLEQPIQTGLDKYCPVCHKKAPSEHFYCKVDGAKLSSLRCPECGTPGEEVDNFCCHCGCPMKAEDRLMEAAATGNRLPEDSHDISASDLAVEDKMRAAMEARVVKTVPAPARPKISMGMFK